MKKNYLTTYLGYALVFLLGCIDPYPVENDQGANLLIVDGILSTGPGPHAIKLRRSDTYGSVFQGRIKAVTEAEVVIRSSDGTTTFLQESTSSSFTEPFFDRLTWMVIQREIISNTGIYFTDESFRAEIGKAYTLHIKLPTGEEYTSLPELITPVPTIDSVSFRPVSMASEDYLRDITGLDVVTHFKDNPEIDNYYLWKTSNGTTTLVTFPEDYRLPRTHPTCPDCPAPKDCCKFCYLPDSALYNNFRIATDDNFSGLSTSFPAIFVVDNGVRFMQRSRFTLHQYGISKEAYQFLRLLRQQLEIDGSVFDPLPANIRGNIISLTNPEQQVLGYFMASDVSSRVVYYNKEDLPPDFRQAPIVIRDDCRVVAEGNAPRSATPPADWIE